MLGTSQSNPLRGEVHNGSLLFSVVPLPFAAMPRHPSRRRPVGRTLVTLGTATPGGGFPAYGQAFAEIIDKIEPSLDVRPQNTKGSTENVPLLEAGKLDLGLVQGEVALEAFNGIGRPPADLRILTAMYATAGMFAVRADSPYRSIADLEGRPVAFGAKGSGLVILARYVLDGLGLDRDRDFQAIFLDRAGDGPAMVIGGKAAALWGGGAGWPGFMAVAKGPVPASSYRTVRHPAHPGQAPVPEDADPAGRHLRGPGRADYFRWLLEFCSRPADAWGGCRLQARARNPQGRGRDAGAQARDDSRQHGGRRAPPRL